MRRNVDCHPRPSAASRREGNDNRGLEGDRSEGDTVSYPDIDMHLKRAEGFFHKDGRKYEP
jgi:hypothetical protein